MPVRFRERPRGWLAGFLTVAISGSSGALGFGVHAFVSVDWLKLDTHAFFVAANLTADYFGTPSLSVWGPSVLVGFRY